MSAGNELSRLLLVDPLADGGLDFALSASPQERAALTKRFDLVAIERLEAADTVVHGPLPASILVEGRLAADAVQTCVTTLEPVPEHVEASFRRLFVLGDDGDDAESEVEIDPLDAVSFVVAPVILLLVAASACILPALRITALPPIQALRQE